MAHTTTLLNSDSAYQAVACQVLKNWWIENPLYRNPWSQRDGWVTSARSGHGYLWNAAGPRIYSLHYHNPFVEQMSNTYAGSCLCGEVRFEIEGEFERFYLCHCEFCRKDTGSAHAANLFSSTAAL